MKNKLKLFDQLVLWAMRHRSTVIISSAEKTNRKSIKIGEFKISELDDNTVSMASKDFYARCEDFDTLQTMVESIREND